jgi:hypothetical protein
MCSAEDEEKSLFISVEEDGGTPANFMFHKELDQEARGVITVLRIMVQYICGGRIGRWFTKEARVETCGWVYKEHQGGLVSPDETCTHDMITDWDEDSIDDDEEPEET